MGGPGATLHPAVVAQPMLVTLEPGAPRVHISSVRLLGRVVVNGGDLMLSDCTFEQHQHPGTLRRRLGTSSGSRAVIILSGHAVFTRTVLRGHAAGAVAVHTATLILLDCAIRDCHAPSGGAMHISGGSNVTISQSYFTNNSADMNGGALQVNLAHLPQRAGISLSVASLLHTERHTPRSLTSP